MARGSSNSMQVGLKSRQVGILDSGTIIEDINTTILLQNKPGPRIIPAEANLPGRCEGRASRLKSHSDHRIKPVRSHLRSSFLGVEGRIHQPGISPVMHVLGLVRDPGRGFPAQPAKILVYIPQQSAAFRRELSVSFVRPSMTDSMFCECAKAGLGGLT